MRVYVAAFTLPRLKSEMNSLQMARRAFRRLGVGPAKPATLDPNGSSGSGSGCSGHGCCGGGGCRGRGSCSGGPAVDGVVVVHGVLVAVGPVENAVNGLSSRAQVSRSARGGRTES